MKQIKTLTILTAFVALTACSSGDKNAEQDWTELPQVTNLDNLKQTDFVPTLENPTNDNKNIIYAPAFLYAWDKVKEELKNEILVNDTNSIDFKLLTQSTSHKNSLDNSEYSVDVNLVDGAIVARAFFNKTLPFETILQKMEEPILFDNTRVRAFGMYYFDEEVAKYSQILYYRDDDNFILKLLPKDKQHEIILVKGLSNLNNLSEALKKTNDLIELGKKEKSEQNNLWKYEIILADIFSIPTINFYIATNYKQLEGQTFSTADKKSHIFNIAYQRTGFILNENGAVVVGEAVAAPDSIGAPEPVITHPKKMIFDKPFYVIIKRTDKTNPYFVMKVNNSELLVKE